MIVLLDLLVVVNVSPWAGFRRCRNPRGNGAFSQSKQTLAWKEQRMPRGDKSSYTGKQRRKAEHIEEGYEKRGVKKKEAERRAWATVNKESGGGKKSGSGRGKKETRVS